MVRRRRNQIVLWEWSRDREREEPSVRRERKRSIGREALGAAILLGVIVFLFSLIPDGREGGYRRNALARYVCEVAGADPGTPACAALTIGAWFAVVIAIGIVLKVARSLLKAIGFDGDRQ
jgi:hypothetical protein